MSFDAQEEDVSFGRYPDGSDTWQQMSPTPGANNTDLLTVELSTHLVPGSVSLEQNYPNPFNPNTQFHYSLTNTENIYLAIYDLLGREIYTIHSGLQRKGAHNVQWTGVNNQGDLVPSGVYICRLKTEVEILSKKMVLNR